MLGRSLVFFAALLTATPVLACPPPPPTVQLRGESPTDYAERRKAFFEGRLDEEQRQWQAALFDNATRVTLARIASSRSLSEQMSDGGYWGRSVEAERLATFKGSPPDQETIGLRDKGMTSCGRYGGGPATAAPVGAYILLFEGLNVGEVTGNLGIPLNMLREPRVLQNFDKVVLSSQLADSAK